LLSKKKRKSIVSQGRWGKTKVGKIRHGDNPREDQKSRKFRHKMKKKYGQQEVYSIGEKRENNPSPRRKWRSPTINLGK